MLVGIADSRTVQNWGMLTGRRLCSRNGGLAADGDFSQSAHPARRDLGGARIRDAAAATAASDGRV